MSSSLSTVIVLITVHGHRLPSSSFKKLIVSRTVRRVIWSGIWRGQTCRSQVSVYLFPGRSLTAHVPFGVVYFNALLATLNQREALQEKLRKPGLSQTLEFMPDVGSAQNTNPTTDSASHEDSVWLFPFVLQP